jgi:hypothetical protein
VNTGTSKLIVCLAVALSLRLAFVFIGFPLLEQRWHLREDGDSYGAIAQTIREGRYIDVTRGPVYPVLVAAAGSPIAMKCFQAVLDTLACLLVFQLARLALRAPRSTLDVPLWASWLWALYPFAIWRVAFINKEVVLAFLLAGYVGLQLAALRDGKLWQWLAAGGVLGLVNLCKPTFLAWPFVIFAFAFLHRVSLVRVIALVAAMIVIVAPWTARNLRVTGGALVPVATEQGGFTTFVGNYQPTLGLWEGPGKLEWMAAAEEIREQNAGASLVDLDRAFYHAAWEQVRSNPSTAFELFVRKCGRFWFLSAARRERVASFAIQAVYLAFLGIGLWRVRPWNLPVVLLVTLILYVMLLHGLSYADLRFSLVVMPLVCVLAAATVQANPRRTAAIFSAAP